MFICLNYLIILSTNAPNVPWILELVFGFGTVRRQESGFCNFPWWKNSEVFLTTESIHKRWTTLFHNLQSNQTTTNTNLLSCQQRMTPNLCFKTQYSLSLLHILYFTIHDSDCYKNICCVSSSVTDTEVWSNWDRGSCAVITSILNPQINFPFSNDLIVFFIFETFITTHVKYYLFLSVFDNGFFIFWVF